MEVSSVSSDNLLLGNGNMEVEILYVETGEESQSSADARSLSVKKPVKTRSIVYQFFNWEDGTNEWACTICAYVKYFLFSSSENRLNLSKMLRCFIGISIPLPLLAVLAR